MIDYGCCDFDADSSDPDDGEEPWHYLLTCLHCGTKWYGLHCPHDGYQNPCPGCGVRPTPVREEAGRVEEDK